LDEKSKDEENDSDEIDVGQENVYKLAKILFDEGKYEQSLQIITLLEKQDLKDNLWLKSTWARLYCEIVLKKEESKKTIELLKKKI
jgi:hypothetical protein